MGQPDQEKGVLIGIVTGLDDPEKLGRLMLKIPTLDDQQTAWARVASPMAGNDRGFFFRPEVGDEVLVALEHGDPLRPYVIGALWSTTDKPPKDDGQPTANNWRFIKSRSGHIIKLDDTQGAEKIEFIDKDNKCHVVIDSAQNKIQLTADSGDIEISASASKISLKAMTIDIQATGEVNIKGSVVNIN
jgi:uncharacterized protein involved in type VI secretion and phage assembly